MVPFELIGLVPHRCKVLGAFSQVCKNDGVYRLILSQFPNQQFVGQKNPTTQVTPRAAESITSCPCYFALVTNAAAMGGGIC
jgi:hypothetical protein